MKKVFVLDTNVLLHDPMAMFRFEDNDVILPITIIEELDRFKKGTADTGRNARYVSRKLDELRKQGSLVHGISLENGGHLKVALCHRDTLLQLPAELEGDQGDNAILAVAMELQAQCRMPVVLVSKDTNLRIKADALGWSPKTMKPTKSTLRSSTPAPWSGWCRRRTSISFWRQSI
jgi:PhoH-like ATPase